jgi:hypothetical protein
MMPDPFDQRLLRSMNEGGHAAYAAPALASALAVALLDTYSWLEALERSGHVIRIAGSEPRTYALTALGMERATAA